MARKYFDINEYKNWLEIKIQVGKVHQAAKGHTGPRARRDQLAYERGLRDGIKLLEQYLNMNTKVENDCSKEGDISVEDMIYMK